MAGAGAPNLKGSILGILVSPLPPFTPPRFSATAPMPSRPPSRPLPWLLLAGSLASLGGLDLGAAVPALALPAASGPTAALLQSLETALNAHDEAPLAALLRAGPGLDPQQLRQRHQRLHQQFPDASWQVRQGSPLRDGRPTVTVKVSGTRVEGGSTYRLDAQQTLILQSDGRQLIGQTVLAESSLLRSGERALPVIVQIPDAVLTGQRYNVDLIVDEPLNGALVAGGLTAVSSQQLAAMESPSLDLGALGGGGLFKTVRAPQTPGSQTWAMLLVHPKGVVSATKRVRVVADRLGLDP